MSETGMTLPDGIIWQKKTILKTQQKLECLKFFKYTTYILELICKVGLSILPRYENKIKNEAPLQMNYNEKGASVFLVAFLTTKYLLYNI